ncbi:MAG: gliding motility-associated C-terminal domain-containing protein, partial [Bacteroidota bacterium]
GFYNLIIRDANGCESQLTNIQVIDDCLVSGCDEPVLLNAISLQATCGNSDGSIRLDMVGDESDYSYAWSGGVSNDAEANNLEAGTYEVTISDVNDPSCFTITQIIVGNADGPQAVIGSIGSSSCGLNTGSASLTPTNFEYSWCNGGSGSSQMGLAPGSCLVTVTDPATGCTNILDVVIGELDLIRVEATVDTEADCGAANGAATIRVFGGSGSYTYQWSDGGTGRIRTDLAAGIYSVTVTDLNALGCDVSIHFVVTEQIAAGAFVTFDNPSAIYNLNCAGDRNGEAIFTAGFEPGFVQPARIEIVDVNGIAQTNGQLAPGDYCVLVYDGNDCLAGEGCFEIIEPSGLSLNILLTDMDCGTPGTVDITAIGGSRPFTYDWADLAGNDDPADRNDLMAGTYSLTLTDANGCTAIADGLTVDNNCSVTCVPPTVLNIVTFDADCDAANGSATIDILENLTDYTFSWTNNVSSTNTATDLAAGIYTVTIAEVNDPTCSTVSRLAIGSADGPQVEIVSTTPASCALDNGTAVLSPVIYTYEWCDGTIGFNNNSLPAGSCIVKVTDPASGCITYVEVEIEQVNNLVVEPQVNTRPNCNQANGSVFIGVLGGSTNYTYQWSDNGSGSPSRDDLAAGTYAVTVTDNGASGCVIVTTFTLVDQLPAAANVVINNGSDTLTVSCAGAVDAVLDFDVGFEAGFVDPATVVVVDLEGNEYDPTALGVGSYCVVVRDGNECIAAEACFLVEEPRAIEADVAIIDADCTEKGRIIVEVRGGSGNTLYDWADLPGTNDAPNRVDLSPGSYDLTITDGGRCPLVLDAIMVADSCPICPLADTLPLVVVVFEEETRCVQIEDCFDAAQTQFELQGGGTSGASAFGSWTVGADGCLNYVANGTPGTAVDTVCVVAIFDNLRDTTCFVIDILSDPVPTLSTDTIYLTTLEETTIDSCLTTVALPADFDNAAVLFPPVNGTGIFAVNPQDSCVSYTPNPGQTGNFIDTMGVVLCDINNVCDTFIVIVSVEPLNCPTLLDSTSVSLTSFDCDAGATYCLGIELNQIGDYSLTLDGQPYNNGFDFCNTDTLLEAALSSLFNQIPTGPYSLESWVVNGDTFRLASFQNVEELVDSMNVWDPIGNWVLDNDVIRGANSSNTYSDLIIQALNLPVEVPVAIREIMVSQGTQIQVDTGQHILIINELATACRDTLLLDVDCIDCPTLYSGADTLQLDDCDSTAMLCLALDLTDLRRYAIFDNGQPYTGPIFGCDFDTLQVYDVRTLSNPGVYELSAWAVDADTLRVPAFSVAQELVSEMNAFDPQGNWTLIGNFIQGGVSGRAYGPLVLEINGNTVQLDARPLRVPNGVAIDLIRGPHEVVVQDTISGCTEIIDILVDCNDIGAGADTLLVIPVGELDTFCVDLSNFDSLPVIRNICPTDSDGNALFSVLPTLGCVEFDARLLGVDSFCLEVCDRMGMCDTIDVVVQVVPVDSTIRDTIVVNQMDTICLDSTIFQGNIDTLFNSCPSLSGTNARFEPIVGTNCLVVTGLEPGTDTACMVLCDDLGNCATTTVIFDVIRPQTDTIRRTVLIDENGSYCLDTTELSSPIDTVFNICPGSSGVFVDFTLESDSLCVTYTGLDIGQDTACLVVCDTSGLCDTSILIVLAEEPMIDPPVAVDDDTLTIKNMPIVINVLNNDTLNGSLVDVRLLDGPSIGSVIVNPDGTVTYVPDQDICSETDSFTYVLETSSGLDTATVRIFIACDDLTVFNGFSPNGDGVNDTFVILGIENFPDNRVLIFNRWGNEIFNQRGYTNALGWNGQWKGKDLPDGTYFYLIDTGEGNTVSGYVQIHR